MAIAAPLIAPFSALLFAVVFAIAVVISPKWKITRDIGVVERNT